MGVSAKVVAHSVNVHGEELVTLEIECHRFILPEFNTHRVFSRNFQSSRAIPVKRMIEMIRENPAYPVHWGKNQSGMQAYEENETPVTFVELGGQSGSYGIELSAKDAWLRAVDEACKMAERFDEAGYHKQIVNRLIEPFMWQKGVVTATREGLESFFKLRSHHAAQPEIKALSDAMKEAVENSTPDTLYWKEWHMPYVESVQVPCDDESGTNQTFYDVDGNELTLEQALKVSASCCAQVSYRRLDDSVEKAERVYDMLNLGSFNVEDGEPPHASPCEHQAMVVDDLRNPKSDCPSGNFACGGWYQYRKMLEVGDVGV